MSELVNDPTGKVLKVKYIQKKSVGVCEIPYLFDQVPPTPPYPPLPPPNPMVCGQVEDQGASPAFRQAR